MPIFVQTTDFNILLYNVCKTSMETCNSYQPMKLKLVELPILL